jgi:hypothetical protein
VEDVATEAPRSAALALHPERFAKLHLPPNGIKPRPTSIFDIELARAETEIGRVLAALAEGPDDEGRIRRG